ncbi:MAG: FimV/HubP family polar landmark protein [Burkholderiaceae bacterium]
MRIPAPRTKLIPRTVVPVWPVRLLAVVATMTALVVTPVRADDGQLQLDPAGTGYTMRLGAAERVALGAAGAVFQIPIEEPDGSKRDAPAVAKVLRVVPTAPEGAARVDVITRRDGVRVVQVVLSGPAMKADEVLLALYWHDGTFRRTYRLTDAPGSPDEVRDPRMTADGRAGGAVAPAGEVAAAPVTAPSVESRDEPAATVGAAATPSAAQPADRFSTLGADARPAAAGSGDGEMRTEGGSATVRETANATPAPTATPPTELLVARGDTLWTLAESVSLPGVTQHQKMLGIYRTNREAFRGNVDNLRAGSRLSVPSAEVLTRVSPDEAIREVLASSRSVPVASAAARPPAGPAAAGKSLVAGTAGRAGDQLEVGVDDKDPAAARERDTAYSMAMAEAQSRIDDLTRQVEQLETLIQLKEIQIADAQERLRLARVDSTPAGSGSAAPIAGGQARLSPAAGDLERAPAPGAGQAIVRPVAPAAAAITQNAAGAPDPNGDGASAAVQSAIEAARRASDETKTGGDSDAGPMGVQAQPPAAAEGSPLLGGFKLPEGFWTFAAGILIALIIVMIVLRLRKRRAANDDEDFDDNDDFLFDESTQMGPDSDAEMFGDSEVDGPAGRETESPRTTTA